MCSDFEMPLRRSWTGSDKRGLTSSFREFNLFYFSTQSFPVRVSKMLVVSLFLWPFLDIWPERILFVGLRLGYIRNWEQFANCRICSRVIDAIIFKPICQYSPDYALDRDADQVAALGGLGAGRWPCRKLVPMTLLIRFKYNHFAITNREVRNGHHIVGNGWWYRLALGQLTNQWAGVSSKWTIGQLVNLRAKTWRNHIGNAQNWVANDYRIWICVHLNAW